TAGRGRGLGGSLDLGERQRALGGGDLLALISLDLGEDVGHRAPQAFAALIRRSSRPFAAPESIDLAASATPSFRSMARPATIRAAAGFTVATSRNGPVLPFSTSSSAAAFSLASPPRSVSAFARASPTSSGAISNVCTAPFCSSAT